MQARIISLFYVSLMKERACRIEIILKSDILESSNLMKRNLIKIPVSNGKELILRNKKYSWCDLSSFFMNCVYFVLPQEKGICQKKRRILSFHPILLFDIWLDITERYFIESAHSP